MRSRQLVRWFHANTKTTTKVVAHCGRGRTVRPFSTAATTIGAPLFRQLGCSRHTSFATANWLTTTTAVHKQQNQKKHLFSSSHRLGGPFSRMLDMGGAPSSNSRKSPPRQQNLGQHLQLQAVIFDFDVVTRSLEDSSVHIETSSTLSSSNKDPDDSSSRQTTSTTTVQPDTNRIEQLAQLLKVNLSDGTASPSTHNDSRNDGDDDDLSLLTGDNKTVTSSSGSASLSPPTHRATPKDVTVGGHDIRSKYAARLQQAGVTVGDVDRSRLEVQGGAGNSSSSSSPRGSTSGTTGTGTGVVSGDAAGHWTARARAVQQQQSSPTRWMAATGTGQLLHYLHVRSMRLGLVGTLSRTSTTTDFSEAAKASDTAHRMDDFTKQLKDRVTFDAIAKPSTDRDDDNNSSVPHVVKTVLHQLLSPTSLSPDRALWVTDRDDSLRAARDAGCLTCRIRPKNARRGNVSAHYTVETLTETQDVIDELNGISFNTVLQQGK